MTTAQRLAVRLSTIRQKLNELSAIDEPTEEQRAELRTLTDQYPQIEDSLQLSLPTRVTRAADATRVAATTSRSRRGC